MYDFIVDMIVWWDCVLTSTILMDLERSTNATNNRTWFDHGDILYRPCIECCCCYYYYFFAINYYFEHLKCFFARQWLFWVFKVIFFAKQFYLAILNYLIIIDSQTTIWLCQYREHLQCLINLVVVLVLELVSVYSPFTTHFKDYILRPSGPNTAL